MERVVVIVAVLLLILVVVLATMVAGDVPVGIFHGGAGLPWENRIPPEELSQLIADAKAEEAEPKEGSPDIFYTTLEATEYSVAVFVEFTGTDSLAELFKADPRALVTAARVVFNVVSAIPDAVCCIGASGFTCCPSDGLIFFIPRGKDFSCASTECPKYTIIHDMINSGYGFPSREGDEDGAIGWNLEQVFIDEDLSWDNLCPEGVTVTTVKVGSKGGMIVTFHFDDHRLHARVDPG